MDLACSVLRLSNGILNQYLISIQLKNFEGCHSISSPTSFEPQRKQKVLKIHFNFSQSVIASTVISTQLCGRSPSQVENNDPDIQFLYVFVSFLYFCLSVYLSFFLSTNKFWICLEYPDCLLSHRGWSSTRKLLAPLSLCLSVFLTFFLSLILSFFLSSLPIKFPPLL